MCVIYVYMCGCILYEHGCVFVCMFVVYLYTYVLNSLMASLSHLHGQTLNTSRIPLNTLQDTSDGDGTTLQEGQHLCACQCVGGTLGSCDPWLSSPQCPHSQKCPLADGSRVPCHFAQRVHLSFTQVRALEWFP